MHLSPSKSQVLPLLIVFCKAGIITWLMHIIGVTTRYRASPVERSFLQLAHQHSYG